MIREADYRLGEATPEQLRERKITSLRQELAYYERNAEEKRKALATLLNENTEDEQKES